DGICGWKPCPHSQIWLAASPNDDTMSRDASINACSFDAAGPVGHTAGLSVRSCGGVQSAAAQSAGATTMWRYCTPGWNDTPSPPSRASSAAITSLASADDG